MRYFVVLLALLSLFACTEPMKPGSSINGKERELLIVELEKRKIEYEIWNDGTIRYDEQVQDEVSEIIMTILMKRSEEG